MVSEAVPVVVQVVGSQGGDGEGFGFALVHAEAFQAHPDRLFGGRLVDAGADLVIVLTVIGIVHTVDAGADIVSAKFANIGMVYRICAGERDLNQCNWLSAWELRGLYVLVSLTPKGVGHRKDLGCGAALEIRGILVRSGQSGERSSLRKAPSDKMFRNSPFNGIAVYGTEGRPIPAALSVASCGPRSVQQSDSLPSMTTAGTERMPRPLARLATFGSCISSTVTWHDGQAMRSTSLTASSQAGHPALKTSTCRLSAILKTSFWKVALVIDLLACHTPGQVGDFFRFGHVFQIDAPINSAMPLYIAGSDSNMNLPTITSVAATRPARNGA